MMRRSVLGFIFGSVIGTPAIKTKPVTTPPVEGGVEPMPSFPLLLMMKRKSDGSSIHLIYKRSEIKWDDNTVKDMIYRRKQMIVDDTTLMLTDCQDVVTDNDHFTFMAQKGMSGESSLYTF